MIDFIYVIVFFIYILLALSFIVKEFFLGLISAFAMMTMGVYILINGMGDVSNFLTESFGIINICLGFFISLKGSIEKIEEDI